MPAARVTTSSYLRFSATSVTMPETRPMKGTACCMIIGVCKAAMRSDARVEFSAAAPSWPLISVKLTMKMIAATPTKNQKVRTI
jgi:hypothetical protein